MASPAMPSAGCATRVSVIAACCAASSSGVSAAGGKIVSFQARTARQVRLQRRERREELAQHAHALRALPRKEKRELRGRITLLRREEDARALACALADRVELRHEVGGIARDDGGLDGRSTLREGASELRCRCIRRGRRLHERIGARQRTRAVLTAQQEKLSRPRSTRASRSSVANRQDLVAARPAGRLRRRRCRLPTCRSARARSASSRRSCPA